MASSSSPTATAAFCRDLKLKYPIVCPPMANCIGGVAAAEVTKAGGIGLVGHASTLKNLQSEVEKGRKHLGLNENDPVPFGIGLVLWKLETPEVSASEADSLSHSFLSYVASLSAHSVWLSFSPHLQEWVKRYRRYEAEQAHGNRSFIFVMPSRTEDTLAAATDWQGVDVVVAQGTESGGHGPSHQLGLPLERLLATVSPRFETAANGSNPSRPYLVAAGGLSSPRSIAKVLEKYPNVAGVVIGTAFTVSEESLWKKPQKELVVRTRGPEETDRGLEWDEIRNQMGWPRGVDGRAIRNQTRGKETSVYEEGGQKGEDGPNLDEVATWAGTGVGDVTAIKPAAEILRDLASQL